MNILELDSYNLADAVKFNDKLNPRIWQGEKMKTAVRTKLLQIAADFKQSLGLDDLQVKDITVSGSNASYTYTPHSDIDLHLVVDLPQADASEVYRELFDAKKFQYNETHNIKIGGYDVELYVENANEPPVSQGMFSVLNDDWINIPLKKRSTVNDNAVKSKYDVMKHRIDSAIASKNFKRISATAAKIKKMRQAGLDKHGELGPENLAYKMLRTQGTINALYDARTAARDKQLSLKEQPKVPQRITYGFTEDVGITPDGVSPSTQMFLNEEDPEGFDELIMDFIHQTAGELGIEEMPHIELHDDPEWSEHEQSFGRYTPETHTLDVNLSRRHIMDIMRTVAHELAHCRQNQDSQLPNHAGETGSKWENEANAIAGVIMRNYAEQHPQLFGVDALSEGASGYIPTKAEADDPRYSMALTVDIKPGQVGKEANKLGLKTNKQGKPALLMKSANLQESLAAEFKLFESGQDLFEVKMTSKNLAKLAKDIKGAKVGLEFEMYVPNVSNDEDSDQEPDYDQDEVVRDIDDAINFFDDGDYNGRNELRRLREQMESDYFDWQAEQLDQDWDNNGFEFFQEYLDREEPFDPEDYQERAEDEIKAEFPEMPPESEGFEELVAEKLREINSEYYVESWEAQGRSYDRAREEFEEEQRENYSERDWLESQGISYASDVQNEYTDLQWPYWSSVDGGEGDIESVALDFMNAMGMDTVAISSSYHGSYKKWVGNGWVSIGSNKPDDCFAIEPDGSLDTPDNRGDAGLEFVSPPIPLEDIGTVMSKVQNWAALRGVYTGKRNKTSIHTNISIPGYDLDKLDYLKAALLLGDEYVLREFDRIGNTYAAPAIEKVKALVKQNPDKAKALLDKMKSQLNVEASKLIHSGQTNKFTSINTKDNRVEFRSPGGDYLSIIADNPQKMIDTINRMVVTLDAAMDPNKYKEEYQKKLYKVLTGQAGGREAKTGAKQEMKKDDKDLLNIFSRYAAGELPKAALKSFVRQAQLERSVAKGKDVGKMWWRVGLKSNPNYEIEVVGSSRAEAIQAAMDANTDLLRFNKDTDFTAKPVRPYEGTQRNIPEVVWKVIGDRSSPYQSQGIEVAAPNELEAMKKALAQWNLNSGPGTPEEFFRAHGWTAQPIGTVAQQPTGPQWGVWDNEENRFIDRFGGTSEEPVTHPSEQAALVWANRAGQQWRLNNGQVEVRRVPQEQPAQQQGGGLYKIFSTAGTLIAGDEYGSDQDALERAKYWAQQRGVDVVVKNAQGQEIGRVSAFGEITPTAQQPAPQQPGSGEYGIWIQASDRFARLPAEHPDANGNPNTLRTFPSREAAERYLTTTRANSVGMRNDIEVREIPQGYEVPPPLGRPVSPAFGGQETPGGDAVSYEIYNRNSGAAIDTFTANNDQEALQKLEDYRNSRRHSFTPEQARLSFGVRRGPGVTNATQPSSVNNLTPRGPGPWEVASRENNQVYYNTGHTHRAAAETEARTWLTQNGHNPDDFEVRTREGVSNTDAAQGGIVDVAGEQPATAPQTLTRPGQGQQVFTGEWKVLIDGEQVYQFGGAGNNQADANRIGREWILQQIRQGTLNPANGADVEVLPVMG